MDFFFVRAERFNHFGTLTSSEIWTEDSAKIQTSHCTISPIQLTISTQFMARRLLELEQASCAELGCVGLFVGTFWKKFQFLPSFISSIWNLALGNKNHGKTICLGQGFGWDWEVFAPLMDFFASVCRPWKDDFWCAPPMALRLLQRSPVNRNLVLARHESYQSAVNPQPPLNRPFSESEVYDPNRGHMRDGVMYGKVDVEMIVLLTGKMLKQLIGSV